VLVGNASAFSSQLKSIGFGEYELVDMANLDLTSADFHRAPQRPGRVGRAERRPAPVPSVRLAAYRQTERVTPGLPVDEGAKAQPLLDRMIAAKGELAAPRTV